MTNGIRFKLCALIFFIFFVPGSVSTEKASSSESLAVIMIVDNSGSMKTNDQDKLRFLGMQLFTSLLEPNDLMGLIVFSSRAETMGDAFFRPGMENQPAYFQNLNESKPNGYTDIKAALIHAQVLLRSVSHENTKFVIVLLTDGKPEIQNPYPEYEQETLDLAAALNVPVMAIALTPASRTPFLDRLANVTNGSVIPADNSADLLDAYLNVLGQIKDRTVIGGEKFNTSATITIDQGLAPYIHSATFVVAKPENSIVQLLDPFGREIDVQAGQNTHFSLVTLETPVGGAYTFRSQGMGEMQAWVILRSRLRVEVISPNNYHLKDSEMPIVIALFEEALQGNYTRIIGEANFTARVTGPDGKETSLDHFYDDGTHGDLLANDGRYTRIFPDTQKEGRYRIEIQGSKEVVPLQAQEYVQVVTFPILVADGPSGHVDFRGQPLDLKVHFSNEEELDTGHVVALVALPSGRIEELHMEGDRNVYRADFLPSEDGEYHVSFETRDAIYRGVAYQTKVEQSFRVTLIPYARVSVLENNMSAACFEKPGMTTISLSVIASAPGSLSFSARNMTEVQPATVNIHKGEQEIQLTINLAGNMGDKSDRVEMLIEGGDGMEVQPEALRFEYQIPSIWVRCQTYIRVVLASLGIFVMGALSIRRIRSRAKPLPVTGTLRHWKSGEKEALHMEVDLTVIGKSALVIGSSARSDVVIPQAELMPIHAHVLAEKTIEGAEILLEPLGEVRKGYNLQIAKFTLRHGDIFQMGSHEFQYLSDSGE